MSNIDLLNAAYENLKLGSNSSSGTLHKCPRCFQLDKLSQRTNEEDEDTRFGHVVGACVQELLASGSRDRAYITALQGWHTDLDHVDDIKKRKTFWHSLFAIDRFSTLRSTYFSNYELVYFEGKPAIELGFSIDIGDGYFYRGFLDALLIHKTTGELIAYEGKTTKFKDVNEASYQNSAQGLGYSVVVDTIADLLGLAHTSSYWVYYVVWKTGSAEWEVLKFKKSHTDRALWLKNILLDKERVQGYIADDYFPMYGESCYSFFRQCHWFGTCSMATEKIILEPVVNIEPDDKYRFKFKLEDIIEAQLKRQELIG